MLVLSASFLLKMHYDPEPAVTQPAGCVTAGSGLILEQFEDIKAQ